jgi:hypothetical protein
VVVFEGERKRVCKSLCVRGIERDLRETKADLIPIKVLSARKVQMVLETLFILSEILTAQPN